MCARTKSPGFRSDRNISSLLPAGSLIARAVVAFLIRRRSGESPMETASCTLPDVPTEDLETFDRPKETPDLIRLSFPEVKPLSWPDDSDRAPRDVPELEGIAGRSPGLRRVIEQVRQVATTDSTVLLLGETGSGKELLATQVHQLGARRGRPMVKVNCAAIPETLIESELFGREKGAFTGALSKQIGLFELADRSTIFLDEIGDLAPDLQVKLLRVLEDKEISRLGSPRPIRVDTRIITATHRNLEQRVSEGLFREDLYYRLNVFPIQVPPLRERVEDIPLLVWRFVQEFSRSFGKHIDTIDRDTMVSLQQYSWPGNIRELRNIVERAMITVTATELRIPVPTSSVASTKRS